MAVKYKRILLKLSGEALSGDKGFGLDVDTIQQICEGIKKAYDMGVEIGIVVGGGNFGAAVPAAIWSASGRIRSECSRR